jgi:holo-[acyl-carrier protein] synthase
MSFESSGVLREFASLHTRPVMNEDVKGWKEKEKSAGLKIRPRQERRERDESGVIIGMGVDLAEVQRIQGAIERYGEPFLRRVYTVAEREYCERFKNKYERFAGRFAAKEAAMKALGTGWRRGVRWVDFEVVREKGGRPTMLLDGEARKIAEELGVKRIALSITHTEAQALAQVIFES